MRLLVVLLLALAPAEMFAADPVAAPVVQAVEITGVAAYRRNEVLHIVRLREGGALRRDPATVAQSLETRYHDDGYPAARATASYDAARQTLILEVDEGRLAATVIEGLPDRATARALQAAQLRPGAVLRRQDIAAAFDRIEAASGGALREGEYRLEAAPDGVRLLLRPERSRIRLTPLIGAGDLRTSRRYNRVDGLNLALGVQVIVLDAAAYNHFRAYAIGDYGWGSAKLRHAVGASRPLGTAGRLTLGYEHHDLTDTDDLFRASGLEEARGTAIVLQQYTDYFRRRGGEAYIFARVTRHAQVGVAGRSDDYRSLPVATDSDRPNPPVPEGHMRSLVATARFSSAEDLYPTKVSERASFLQRSLYGLSREPPHAFRAEATLETASPDTLGGDFDFRRLIANLRGHVALSRRTALDSRVILGLSSGAVPLPKRFSLGGVGTLRGYPTKAFPGENIAVATAEWRFDPGRLLPRLAVFYDGGVAWTRGHGGQGWKSAFGAGLKWPASASLFLRVDLARAVGDPAETRVRALVRLQVPF